MFPLYSVTEKPGLCCDNICHAPVTGEYFVGRSGNPFVTSANVDMDEMPWLLVSFQFLLIA